MLRSVSAAHLEESALLRLVAGELPPAERLSAGRHLRACAGCRGAFRATGRLDSALRAAGPALVEATDEEGSLPAGDPFARRPEARPTRVIPGVDTLELAEATVRAVPEARELASRLAVAFEDDEARGPALAALGLGSIRDRLALAYALDEAAGRAEENAPRWKRCAAAVLHRLSNEAEGPAADAAGRAMPISDLRGRALLLSGVTALWAGDFDVARTGLLSAWQAFAEGRRSEPLLARTETTEALRRAAEGRWAEAETLAARAGDTFALTGAGADAAGATLAAGLAAWGAGRARAAVALLRKAALGFGRAEAWSGFAAAACAAALCLATDGRVAESRRAFRDLRRRKARRAPPAERMFVRETERIALLLVPEPRKKKSTGFSFSPGDVLFLRAASALGDGIAAAARESDEKLKIALPDLHGNPARGFALLYACQKGSALVVQDPLRALELARALFEEAKSLMDANTDLLLTTPAPRETVEAEANLLESQALLQLGYAPESRVAAAEARAIFHVSGDAGFGLALADYYEGSAALFSKEYLVGERLLKKASKVFHDFGQDHFMGRAKGALGTLYLHRGHETRALPFLDRSVEMLRRAEDFRPLTALLTNRGAALARLGHFDEAQGSYAWALSLARKLGSRAHFLNIRNGLGQMDLMRGKYLRAIQTFQEIAAEERAAGWTMQALFSDLFVAECLGRLGRRKEMTDVIAGIRNVRKANPFGPSPAMEELFLYLDKGMLTADAIANLRSFLEQEVDGVERERRGLGVVG